MRNVMLYLHRIVYTWNIIKHRLTVFDFSNVVVDPSPIYVAAACALISTHMLFCRCTFYHDYFKYKTGGTYIEI